MPIQDNWRWCNKCQELTFAGGANFGPCPAGGQHNHGGSGNYGLVYDDVGAFGQDNWRWCNQCAALCFAGGLTPGKCPEGGTHNHTGSGNYVVTQKQDGQPGQDNWRWCSNCQVLAFAGSPTPGPCAAGGVHNHTTSGDYVLALVPDCHPDALLQQINALEQKIQAIQNAPGYIQGPHSPQPGKPEPGPLAEVKKLENQLEPIVTAYDNCTGAQNKAVFDVVCDGKQCVSISQVYANIAARLNGKVVGYSCSVGRTLTYGSWGFARTPADSPAWEFASYTKMTVASVSKVITALAAIRILFKHGISVDLPIGGHLPWSVDPCVAEITFRQLLTHQSGIKDYGNVKQDYGTVKKFFTQSVDLAQNSQCSGPKVINPPNPINPNNKNVCYSNYNFSIFRILLPFIDGTPDDADKLAAAYVKICQNYVFEPVGALGVDCKPPASGLEADRYAFAYQFPGTNSGTDWGDNTSIAGAAGWYLSVEDIAAVLVSLNKNDGRILTPVQLAYMEKMGLGWDALTDLQTGYRWVEKNGAWGSGNNILSTSVALFGPGVLGVLFMNSDVSGEPGVIASNVLHDAYMNALTPQK